MCYYFSKTKDVSQARDENAFLSQEAGENDEREVAEDAGERQPDDSTKPAPPRTYH